MGELPSFSIVVPTYQRRELVCDAVRAIARIEYSGPLELIVVIDGSSDGTEAALGPIDCPFPKRVVSQRNTGLAGARNRGVAESTGEVVLFLDDDMICQPDIVEQHARSHREGADAVLGHIPLDPLSPPGFLSEGVGEWADERAERLGSGAPLPLSDLIGGHLSVRREVFERIGGFDRTFTEGGSYGDEDLDLGLRLFQHYDIRFNRHAVAFQRYVVTPAQAMKQQHEAGKADVIFARKHPARARELFRSRGVFNRKSQVFFAPAARLPLLPKAVAAAAIAVADRLGSRPGPAKRFAKWFYDRALYLTYWSGIHAAGGIAGGGKPLVLCYHAMADLSGDPVLDQYGIEPEAFAAQLDSLRARGFNFVGGDAFCAWLESGVPLPRKPVLLTFDDCYAELADVAREVLQPRSVPALAFAVTGMETNEWDRPIGAGTLRLLDPAGLGRLQNCGVEIGCHSRNHRKMTELGDAELIEETRGAADDLRAMGLPRPRFFAFPHGLNDPRCRDAVRAAGFGAAFGLTKARVGASSDRFDLPRVEILAKDRGWRFRHKTGWPQAWGMAASWRASVESFAARLTRPGLRRRVTGRLASIRGRASSATAAAVPLPHSKPPQQSAPPPAHHSQDAAGERVV